MQEPKLENVIFAHRLEERLHHKEKAGCWENKTERDRKVFALNFADETERNDSQ